MATLPLIPTTVIGSWSFPGWYAHFCEESQVHPEKCAYQPGNDQLPMTVVGIRGRVAIHAIYRAEGSRPSPRVNLLAESGRAGVKSIPTRTSVTQETAR